MTVKVDNAWGKWERQRENGEIYDIFLVQLIQAGINGQSNKISQESQFRLRRMI